MGQNEKKFSTALSDVCIPSDTLVVKPYLIICVMLSETSIQRKVLDNLNHSIYCYCDSIPFYLRKKPSQFDFFCTPWNKSKEN